MTVGQQVKQTLASLKSAQASMEKFKIQTSDENTRATFENTVIHMQEIIEALQQRVHKLESEEPQYRQ